MWWHFTRKDSHIQFSVIFPLCFLAHWLIFILLGCNHKMTKTRAERPLARLPALDQEQGSWSDVTHVSIISTHLQGSGMESVVRPQPRGTISRMPSTKHFKLQGRLGGCRELTWGGAGHVMVPLKESREARIWGMAVPLQSRGPCVHAGLERKCFFLWEVA